MNLSHQLEGQPMASCRWNNNNEHVKDSQTIPNAADFNHFRACSDEDASRLIAFATGKQSHIDRFVFRFRRIDNRQATYAEFVVSS